MPCDFYQKSIQGSFLLFNRIVYWHPKAIREYLV